MDPKTSSFALLLKKTQSRPRDLLRRLFPVGCSCSGALDIIANKRAVGSRMRGEVRRRVCFPSLLGC